MLFVSCLIHQCDTSRYCSSMWFRYINWFLHHHRLLFTFLIITAFIIWFFFAINICSLFGFVQFDFLILFRTRTIRIIIAVRSDWMISSCLLNNFRHVILFNSKKFFIFLLLIFYLVNSCLSLFILHSLLLNLFVLHYDGRTISSHTFIWNILSFYVVFSISHEFILLFILCLSIGR